MSLTPKQEAYVYALVDPRDGKSFYIGKGRGGRIHSHVAAVRAGKVDNPGKCQRIREILSEGLEVSEIILATFATDDEAYSEERRLIDATSGLTNLRPGQSNETERAQEMAKSCIGRMKPFQVWMATAGVDRLQSARRIFGSERACYDTIKAELEAW